MNQQKEPHGVIVYILAIILLLAILIAASCKKSISVSSTPIFSVQFPADYSAYLQ